MPGLSCSLEGTKILFSVLPSTMNLCLTQLGAGLDAALILKGTSDNGPEAGRRKRENKYL